MTNAIGLKKGLSGTAIKIIALILMTIDHVGFQLFNNNQIMRCIGRLAFPLFAFMIAEGCYYTKNKLKHFLIIFTIGLACQVVYYIAEHSLYLNILLTFSFSELLIYSYVYILKKKNALLTVLSIFLFLLVFGVALFLGEFASKITGIKKFELDYGIFGVFTTISLYI